MQKDVAAADEEVRKLRDEVKQKEERVLFFCPHKVEKNQMADADMAAELQGLQAAEERRSSNASHTGDSCLEALWQQIAAACAAVGPNQIDALASAVVQRFKEIGAVQKQGPGRDERIRNGEEEQEQGRASQQVALPTPGGFIQGAPARSLELDLPLVRGVPGERKIRHTQVDRKRGPSRSPGRHSKDEGADDVLKDWCLKRKEKQPGRDPSTQERNSQGEDTRTLEDSSTGGIVSARQIHSQRKDPRGEILTHKEEKLIKRVT